MYNKDILIDEIKNNKLPITKSEIEELSLSDSYVGKSDKDILQALVDLDLLLKKFFFRMMKKSKEKGLDFFKLCHKKMKKAYEVWSMACSNEYERNKLGTIYENSMFMHKEFYRQKTFASKEPLITVLMPTFNSENYIGETLWSVFEQTCPDFELLIMNEAGSSYETTEVISFFEDDRIKVVQNKTKLGLAESLNEGIRIARGKYIARIDADDLATEDRFELQADFLENNKEYGLCGSRQHHFGVDTDFVHEVAEEHDDIKAALIYGCEICHSTIMIRREYFLKNNLFYDNTKKAEDYELWTRAVHKFKFHNIKKVLGEYRVGAENITKNKFNALSAESAVIAANNLSKYLNVNVSKAHLEYLTGWENRFEEVEEKERKVALEEEEAILREMVKNNLIYKNYKDSSLLIAINRRWRWILGKYSYGHDLDEVLNVDDLFKKYPFSEIRCDEGNCTDKSFSLKQCLKGVLKFFYTPFRHGISYKMRQQLWDLDGHLKDSKDEILNNVTDSKYDILNHVKDSETRLKQQTYLMLEKNGNELYDQLERSIEKLEGQVESIKAMVESQNASLKEMIDSRIYKAETNLGQTLDSRIYKAETNLGQTFDSRIYKAETNLGQTFDSRIYKAEENLSQTFDSRIYKTETNLGQAFDGRIYKAEENLSQTFDSRIYKTETNLGQAFDSRIYKAETNLGQALDGRIYKAEENLSQTFDSRIYKTETNLGQAFDGRIYKAEENLSQTFDSRIYKTETNLGQAFDGRIYKAEENLSQTFDSRIWEAESNISNKVEDGFTMVHKHIDFCYSDIFVLLDKNIENTSGAIKLETEYPVAYESNDHIVPHGTVRDDTRYPRFIHACEMYFKDITKLAFVDLGCSSGGIVLDALLRGHEAVGLEGSDESFKQQRAQWRVIPKNLFTCDVTKPFVLKKDGSRKEFDVISAWEMLEHIKEDDLDGLLTNIKVHLKSGGIFVGSIANWDDIDEETGVNWHVNLHPYEWWAERFREAGFEIITEKFSPYDMARGTFNPPHCYEFPSQGYDPEKDFYIVAKKK